MISAMIPKGALRADRRVGLMLAGIVLLAFVALGTTVVLPATDPSVEAQPRQLSAEELRGMRIYRAEGCWYCHTGYVRETTVDSALGDASDPARLGGLSPAMLGAERTGPDLSAVGTRFADPAALVAYLEAPGKDHPRTAMPSYAFLSNAELEALAAYLLAE
jgi:cbb3-type cytochrome oxidase cytochrome c subunit